MTHIPNYYKDDVRQLFDTLGADPYSYLWCVVGDFEINGHEVQITSSTQAGQVIIDNCYVKVGGNGTVVADDEKYTNIDYAMHKLGF